MNAVYMLAGEDAYLKDDALKNLKDKTLGPYKGEEKFNYRVFYAENAKLEEIIDNLRSLTFLERKQLVLVRNFDNFSSNDKKRILKYSKNPNKSSVLVLEITNKSNLKKDIYKELLEQSQFIDCSKPPLSSISRWIVKFAKLRKKRISKEALQLLIINLSNDLNALNKAMEKLSLYVGDKDNITSKDVEVLIGSDINYSAYNLSDAVGRKDIQSALKIIKRLAVNKDETMKLLGRINWHFERIAKAKELFSQGYSNHQVANFLNIHTFFMGKFMKQVGVFSQEAIEQVFKYIMDADLELKTRKIKSVMVLESLVFKLCSLN